MLLLVHAAGRQLHPVVSGSRRCEVMKYKYLVPVLQWFVLFLLVQFKVDQVSLIKPDSTCDDVNRLLCYIRVGHVLKSMDALFLR